MAILDQPSTVIAAEPEDQGLSGTRDDFIHHGVDEYAEIPHTHYIPTKSGDADDTHLEEERPSSAGTGKSIGLDSDDIAFIKSHAAKSSKNDDEHGSGQNTVVKPKLIFRFEPDTPETKTFFSFGKAPQSNANLTRGATILSCSANTVTSYDSVSNRPADQQAPDRVNDSSKDGNVMLADSSASVRNDNRQLFAQHPAHRNTNKNEIDDQVSEAGDIKATMMLPMPIDAANKENASANPEAMAAAVTLPPDKLPFDTSVTPKPTSPSSRRTASQPSHQSHRPASQVKGMDEQSNSILQKVSDHTSSVRVTKKKRKKASRTTNNNTNTVTSFPDGGGMNVNDFVMVLQYKIQQDKRCEEGRITAAVDRVRGEYERKLAECVTVNETTTENLNRAVGEQKRLLGVVEQQGTKLSAYQSRVNGLRKFTEGLGKDIENLRKTADTNHRRYDKLFEENACNRADREGVMAQLDLSLAENSKLKQKTLETARKSYEQSRTVIDYCKSLEGRLIEKEDMLSQERTCRSQLEAQALPRADLSQTIVDRLDMHDNAFFDKLSNTLTAFTDRSSTGQADGILQETHAAVTALSEKMYGENESVKLSIDKLEQRISHEFQEVQADTNGKVSVYLKDAVSEVRAALKAWDGQHDERNEEAAADRSSFLSFQERIATFLERIPESDAKAVEAQKTIEMLVAEKSTLQATVAALQECSMPTEGIKVQLEQLQAELDKKVTHLKSTTESLNYANEELRDLLTVKDSLEKEKEELNARCLALQASADGVEGRIQLAEARVRSEMQSHVARFETELKTRAGNDIKKLTGENGRLQKKYDALQEAFSTYKAGSIGDSTKSSPDRVQRQDSERNQDLVETQKAEIAALRTTIDELKLASRDDAALNEECSSLSRQLQDQKTTASALRKENLELSEQMRALKLAEREATRSHRSEKTELESKAAKLEAMIDDLKVKLDAAIQAAETAASDLQQYQTTSQAAIDEARQSSEHQVEDLQSELKILRENLQRTVNEGKTFRSNVEQTWEETRRQFEIENTELKRQLRETETRFDHILKNNKALQNDCREPYAKDGEQTEKSLSSHIDHFEIETGHSAQVKPAATTDSLLLPTSSRASLPGQTRITNNHTPNCESHCHANTDDDSQILQGSHPAEQASLTSATFQAHLWADNDEMLSITGGSQQEYRTVPEAHMQAESLPSFAAFKPSLQNSSEGKLSSPDPFVDDSELTHKGQMYSQGRSNSTAQARPTMYERFNGQSSDELAGAPLNASVAGSRQVLEGGLHGHYPTPTQKHNEESQNTFPRPNSASKRVHHSSQRSHYFGPLDTQNSILSQTFSPNAVKERATKPTNHLKSGFSDQSSSPGMIPDSLTRKISTYSSATKPRTSSKLHGKGSVPNRDPRVAARQLSTGMKRKAARPIDQEDAYSPPKRRSSRTKASGNDPLRSQTQRSAGGASGVTSVPSSARLGSSASKVTKPPLKRAATRHSARSTTATKRRSSQDDYAARSERFKQELEHR